MPDQLGGKLVSEATQQELLWAVKLSRSRMDFLNWVLATMNNPVIPELTADSAQWPAHSSWSTQRLGQAKDSSLAHHHPMESSNEGPFGP